MASAGLPSLPPANNSKNNLPDLAVTQQSITPAAQNPVPPPHPSAMPQSQPPPQTQQQQIQQQHQDQNHQIQSPHALQQTHQSHNNLTSRNASTGKPVDYKNGKKVEPVLFNYTNYYNHREDVPQQYHPLVQYLENTELKYHNDNLHENSVIGFPTRAQLLREKIYHLPVLSNTAAEKSRYQRKVTEKNQALVRSRRKYDFSTYDQKSAHYFLTGARYNRSDTIDSKMLNKCGVFVNKNKPDLVYIKSNERALNSFAKDMEDMNSFAISNDLSNRVLTSKSCQYPDFTERTKEAQ